MMGKLDLSLTQSVKVLAGEGKISERLIGCINEEFNLFAREGAAICLAHWVTGGLPG
jgi:hypothetical protein